MTIKSIAGVGGTLPLGGWAVPEPRRYLLQERTPDGTIVRQFEHAAASCAADELVILRDLQPGRYANGQRFLVVVDPAGVVIAHTGDVRQLLPEWDAVEPVTEPAEPSYMSVGTANCGGPR